MATGSKHPFPWPDGGPASLRASLYNALSLAARVGAQIGIGNDQMTGLARGQDVVFTREQLAGFIGGDSRLPSNLNDHAQWTLSGDNTLTAVTS